MTAPLRGVFGTRSADRPNPVGIHRVRIAEIASPTRMRVLDAHGQPVPIGVTGELYIGGDGVAYLHHVGGFLLILVVTGSATSTQNTVACVNRAGVAVVDSVLEQLAASEAVAAGLGAFST